MRRNGYISGCISTLENLCNQLIYVAETNQYSDGINTAIFCIKDTINSRIDYLRSLNVDSQSDDDFDEKTECYCELMGAVTVLSSDCENINRAKDFDNGFYTKINEYMKKLQRISEIYS